MGAFDECIDCPAREVGCHSTCEIYLQAKKKYNKEKEEKRLKHEFDSYMGAMSVGWLEENLNKKQNKYMRGWH